MNAKERLTYWRKVERLREQLDRKYFNATKQSILKQFKRFAGDIKKMGTSAAISRLGLDLWEKELIKVFENLYKEATLQFGNATYRVLKIEANQKQQTFGFNAQWTKEVNDFLANQGFTLVSDITKTTKDKMTSIVQKAIEQGLSTDEIVRVLLSDEQINYAVFRARRIVRTEVMRASNMGAMAGAQSHGFEVNKQWIAARDKRTRRIPEEEFDHWDMDGKVVAFDEPFTSTSKKGQPVEAMQPGDITAPAGFTINCRCTVGFIPKRDRNGRLVMKPTANTPTINKPIISELLQPEKSKPGDFIPAKNIKEAEEWAKNNLKTKITSYKGYNIDVANTINKTLAEIEPQFKNLPLTYINSDVTGSAYGQFDWKTNTVNIRKNYKNIEQRLESDNEKWRNKYKNANPYHASTDLRGLVIHEFAHAFDYHTQRSLYDEINRLPIELQNKAYGVSGYASSDRFNGFSHGQFSFVKGAEMVAELVTTRFTAKDRYNKLPIEIRNIVDKYFN